MESHSSFFSKFIGYGFILVSDEQMIRPFMDPKTVKKVRFLNSRTQAGKDLTEEIFDLTTLEKDYGGQSDWKYNHEEYGKLKRLDDAKAAAYWGFEHKILSPEPKADHFTSGQINTTVVGVNGGQDGLAQDGSNGSC